MVEDDASIVVLDNFIRATRDSGYKGTTSALSELVDNSLQAGAKNVWISIENGGQDPFPVTVAVMDDGCGMEDQMLRQSLRFGGTSRFDDRSGLGRYGMGLPNASLGQAQRVDVYSWKKPSRVRHTHLDVDEIAEGRMKVVPCPASKSLPPGVARAQPKTGTLVLWSRCDRLSHSRISTLTRKLHRGLGRIFRHFLWNRVSIHVNGEKVMAIDPLFISDATDGPSAKVFGAPVHYEIAVPTVRTSRSTTGKVRVTFTELPVKNWHSLTNEQKRDMGIANGAGVSVVRGNREVDYGWFFMGTKRRENYDDWWRAEVAFDPILDEAFGITHTKQQIRPQEYLTEILATDMEGMAKALNARVRRAHLRLKTSEATLASEETAAQREKLLPRLPRRAATSKLTQVKALLKEHPELLSPREEGGKALEYKIVEAEMRDNVFFTYALANGRFVLVLNPEHPFYRRLYRPLLDSENNDFRQVRSQLELLILAAARAEATVANISAERFVEAHRTKWSDILATYLNR